MKLFVLTDTHGAVLGTFKETPERAGQPSATILAQENHTVHEIQLPDEHADKTDLTIFHARVKESLDLHLRQKGGS
jgi:hypothetical protein